MKQIIFFAASLFFSSVAVEIRLEMVRFPHESHHTALLAAEDLCPCLVDPSCTVSLSEIGKKDFIGLIVRLLNQYSTTTGSDLVSILITGPDEQKYNIAEHIYGELLLSGKLPTIFLAGSEHDYSKGLLEFLQTSDARYLCLDMVPCPYPPDFLSETFMSPNGVSITTKIIMELTPPCGSNYQSFLAQCDIGNGSDELLLPMLFLSFAGQNTGGHSTAFNALVDQGIEVEETFSEFSLEDVYETGLIETEKICT